MRSTATAKDGARGWRLAPATAALCGLIALATAAPAGAQSRQQWLALAEHGVAQARTACADNTHGLWNGKENVPIAWYDEKLNDTSAYPLATIWGVAPLWDSMSADAVSDPSPSNRAAVESFSVGPTPVSAPRKHRAKRHRRAKKRHRGSSGRATATAAVPQGAQAYWDGSVGGFAPYPGDRGKPNVWCDDNAWWGLAFMDAHLATGDQRLLALAQKAFDFLVSQCWDAAGGGGFWWNTDHTPAGQKAGEPLAAGSLLGALLAQAYRSLGQTATANSDLQAVERWLSWGDAHFADPNGLYWRTQDDTTPTPYIAGPTVEAKQVLCQLNPPGNSYCQQAKSLADAAYQRFADRLNMGPQFDVIYLHWMMVYGQQTGDPRWVALATEMANEALANSRDPATGLYERAWDGSDMSAHQAEPNMLRTDTATVELFAWLAIYG